MNDKAPPMETSPDLNTMCVVSLGNKTCRNYNSIESRHCCFSDFDKNGRPLIHGSPLRRTSIRGIQKSDNRWLLYLPMVVQYGTAQTAVCAILLAYGQPSRYQTKSLWDIPQ